MLTPKEARELLGKIERAESTSMLYTDAVALMLSHRQCMERLRAWKAAQRALREYIDVHTSHPAKGPARRSATRPRSSTP
jgi:hypothetical protein